VQEATLPLYAMKLKATHSMTLVRKESEEGFQKYSRQILHVENDEYIFYVDLCSKKKNGQVVDAGA
jgi:hypothetical protein